MPKATRQIIDPFEKVKLTNQANKALENSSALLHSILESTADGILVVDCEGNIVTYNSQFFKMWNLPPRTSKASFINAPLAYLLPQLKAPKQFLCKLKELHHQTSFSDLDEIEFLDGRVLERHSIPQRLKNKIIGRVFSFRDITQRKILERELFYQATYDALTGTANRGFLIEKLHYALQHAKRTQTIVAVLFLDLDCFKNINDSLGHILGDLLLQKVASRLKTSLRKADLLARWGGDEFSIVLENVKQKKDIIPILQRYHQTFTKPFNIGSHVVDMTCSIGVSLYPQDADSATSLLKHADSAMYAAKHAGRNTYRLYNTNMTNEASKSLIIENERTKNFYRQSF